MNKYLAKFIGISKTVYAYNLEQAIQEATLFAIKRGLKRNTIIDCEEFVEDPPYFGIYNGK